MEKLDLYCFENHYQNGFCRFQQDDLMKSIYENEDSYEVLEEPPFPEMVCTRKFFDANTLTLKTCGSCLKLGGVRIGVWKEYDIFGNVVDETDYEEGWQIGWNEMRSIMEQHHIDLKSVVGIDRFINKNEVIEKIEPKDEEKHDEDFDEESEAFEEDDIDDDEEDKKEEFEDFDEVLFAEFGEEYTAYLKEKKESNEPEEPEYRWVITTLVGTRMTGDYFFDGITGELVQRELNEL